MSRLALLLMLASCSHSTEAGASDLRIRLEGHLERARNELAQDPTHYGLVYEVDQARLLTALQHIEAHPASGAFVLGSPQQAEPHGGGILALILRHWRPEGQAARLSDRFPFAAGRQPLTLSRLYSGHKRRLFLPLRSRAAYPRMRFQFAGVSHEVDAFSFLGLLLEFEDDPTSSWTNLLGQKLELEALMQRVLQAYLSDAVPDEAPDHTRLHAVELLLRFDRRRNGDLDVTAVKERFLVLALRPGDQGNARREIAAHDVETAGLLLAHPRAGWQAEELAHLRAWLHKLERDDFADLEGIPLAYLCHLLRGLRLIEEGTAA